MSNSPWNDFFEEPSQSPVDRNSVILSSSSAGDNDLGVYNYDYSSSLYDYNPPNVQSSENDLSNIQNSRNSIRASENYDQPVDELQLKAAVNKQKTERKKSKNADLSNIFSNDDETNPDDNFKTDSNPNEINLEYEKDAHSRVPFWKQLINLFIMSISVVLLPWMVYSLIITFLLTHVLFIDKILPVDIFYGYIEIIMSVALSIIFGIAWNALSIIACRMWIRRVILPAIYILTLVALFSVVLFLILAFATQFTAIYAFGIFVIYIIVLLLIIPVWILRFIKQEYMIRYFAKRILIYMWNHKIAIPLVLLGTLLQAFICFLIFIFNGYWYYSIPVGLIAMDVIRNSILYAICRMDRHYLENGKSNSTLSVSYFLEATVFKMVWIVLATLLSILQPLISALRSFSLALITLSVGYNFFILFLLKIIKSDTNEENKNKKTAIVVVLGILFGPLAIMLLILSYILIFVSIIFYIILEFLLIFMNRGVIASMGFFQENWFQAIFRQIRTRLRGGFFTMHPLSEADTLFEKMKCLVFKLLENISEVSEANNVLLYFSEMGSIISACLGGVSAYWWIGKVVPTDEANMNTRKNFYPYYQGILVCLAIGYILTGTVLQLIEAHTHSLCLCIKYHNLSLLSKFTKLSKKQLKQSQKKKKNEEEPGVSINQA